MGAVPSVSGTGAVPSVSASRAPSLSGGGRSGRIVVDAWSPDYGAPVADGFDDGPAEVDVGVERAPEEWAPISTTSAPARCVAFVDGTRRIDARLALLAPDGEGTAPRQGLAASVAAGVVIARGSDATVLDCHVDRWLIMADVTEPLRTRHGDWLVRRPAADDAATLNVEVQQAMAEAEVAVAAGAAATAPDTELIVVDGPVRRRETVPGVVGHIKAHHRSYLPPAQAQVVGELAPGQRTPLFAITDGGERYAWYLRLPGPAGHPWAAIVRGEVPANVGPAVAAARADLAAATLVRFASQPAKDPRAPQNLVPIGGLERRLRHRLGDPGLVYRALRTAAAASVRS